MSPKTSLAGQLTIDQTAELLQVSLSDVSRPIDVLVERLSQPDGEVWLNESLNAALSPRELEVLRGTDADEAAIGELKASAKRQLAAAPDQQAYLEALTIYCLTVARGMVSCDRLMSSRSGEEWAELFADLASVVSIQWRETISKAAELSLQHSGG